MSVSDWSTSASSNTSVGGKNIGENMLRSDVNDAMRAMMADIKAKFDEVRSLQDFGAVAYSTFASASAGTDSTTAVQAALDWAYNSGASQRALLVNGFFKCGAITLYTTVTLIGMGRQCSGFVAKAGTTGKWFDTANAQKITLKDLCFYGASITTITHILNLDTNLAGTEGFIEGCWFRDAPEAYGLYCNGNVYYVRLSTFQTVKYGLKGLGNCNKADTLTFMQCGQSAAAPTEAVSMDIDGWDVRGLHIEAPVSQSLPIRMTGSCHVSDITFSPAAASNFDCLAEINTLNHTDYSFSGLHVENPSNATITSGVFKIGSTGAWKYRHGGILSMAQGKNLVSGIDATAGNVYIASRKYQSFRLTIKNNAGSLQVRIGSPGDSSQAATYADKINGASATFAGSSTVLSATFSGGVAGFNGTGHAERLAFDTNDQESYQFVLLPSLGLNTCGTSLQVHFQNFQTTVNSVTRYRPVLEFYDQTGTAFALNTTNIAAGKEINVQVMGYLL